MPFSTVFELYPGGRNNGHAERGMIPIAMAIINPRKEYWPRRGSKERKTLVKEPN